MRAGVFRGIHRINLDSKGRLAAPARCRERLAERSAGKVVCTVHQSGCVLVYPHIEWEAIERELDALPSFDPVAGETKRMMLAHASECELDGQGRFLLPLMLRRFARLDKTVVWAGLGRKAELWDEAAWETRAAEWQQAGGPSQEALPPSLARLTI